MDPRTIWIIAAVIVVGALVLGWFLWQRQRTARLRGRFGPEYARQVKSSGNVMRAEAALAEREKRVERLRIRALSADEATSRERRLSGPIPWSPR